MSPQFWRRAALALAISTTAMSLFAAPRHEQYPGSARLSDSELTEFIAATGGRFPPGTFLPHWASRYVARVLRADRTSARFPRESATIGPNTNVSADPLGVFSETFVAIDRTRPLRLVAGANQISGDAQMIYHSPDGGLTWVAQEMALGNALFQSDPGVGWDSRGNVYVSALGCDTAACEVQVVKSRDGGATWDTAPNVIHSSPGNDKALLAVDDRPASMCRDQVCTAWTEVRGGSTMDLHVACAASGMAPWNDVVVATGTLFGAAPAFGPDGELLVAWQNIGNRTIDIARSDDCGQSFSAPTPIASIGFPFDLGIPAMCSRRVLIYPAIDIDRGNGARRGNIYAVWTDSAPGSACPWNACDPTCSTDVRFSRSSDGGMSWTAPSLVHANGPGDDQFNPWIAVDDLDGSVHVMWYDTRADPARLQTNVYYRRSTDGGDSWEPEIRVTSAPTDESTANADAANQYGDYNGLAAFQCRAFPFWTDRRDDLTEQVFTAPITTRSPPADIANSLRLTRNFTSVITLSWTDLGADEVDYRIYRGRGPDFAVNPPTFIGRSGGGNNVMYTDLFTPLAPGAWLYKVRARGPCNLESASW